MKKSYSVRKLDRRYVGGDNFRYRVEITDQGMRYPEKADLYRRMREWCRSNWGASAEVRHDRMFRNYGFEHNDYWCYDGERFDSFCIYLKGEAELVLFELRWPIDQ